MSAGRRGFKIHILGLVPKPKKGKGSLIKRNQGTSTGTRETRLGTCKRKKRKTVC